MWSQKAESGSENTQLASKTSKFTVSGSFWTYKSTILMKFRNQEKILEDEHFQLSWGRCVVTNLDWRRKIKRYSQTKLFCRPKTARYNDNISRNKKQFIYDWIYIWLNLYMIEFLSSFFVFEALVTENKWTTNKWKFCRSEIKAVIVYL